MTTYYKTSADAGAPVLTGQNGSMVNNSNTGVLDWFLTTICGLTKTYSATSGGIFTMSNGELLKFNHDSAVSGDARLCTIRGVESASAFGTNTDPYPTIALVAEASCNFVVSNTANSTARSWWALLDTVNHVLIFMVDTNNAAATTAGFVNGGFYWSGMASDVAGDTSYNTVLFCRNNATTNTGTAIVWNQFANQNPPSTVYWKRSPDGTLKSSKGFLGPCWGNTVPNDPGAANYPHPYDSKMRRQPISVADAFSIGSTPGASAEPIRIWLPHTWQPLHVAGGFSGINVGDTFTDTDYNTRHSVSATFAFFPIGTAVGGNGAVILETTDTWQRPRA